MTILDNPYVLLFLALPFWKRYVQMEHGELPHDAHLFISSYDCDKAICCFPTPFFFLLFLSFFLHPPPPLFF